jgi:toxin YhaV
MHPLQKRMNKLNQPLIIHGWSIFAHPLFLAQVEELVQQVQQLRQKSPQNYKQKNATKRLAAIAKLAFDVIPQDPTGREYRQGSTLVDLGGNTPIPSRPLMLFLCKSI